MAILCLGNSSLRIDGYGFIGELALDGSVRPVTGVLPARRRGSPPCRGRGECRRGRPRGLARGDRRS